jgi:hypothetical protein
MTRLVLAVAAVTLFAGCYSSRYTPQSRGRVSMMMRDSQMVYVRDGRIYQHGMFGRGLQDVVRGNPYAEAAARAYTSRQKQGFWMTLGGLGCALGAATIAAVRVADTAVEEDPPVPIIEIGAAIGCLVVSYVGIFRIAGAEAIRWDAINIFNDGPTPAPCAPNPGAAPGFSSCTPKRKPERGVSLTMER